MSLSPIQAMAPTNKVVKASDSYTGLSGFVGTWGIKTPMPRLNNVFPQPYSIPISQYLSLGCTSTSQPTSAPLRLSSHTPSISPVRTSLKAVSTSVTSAELGDVDLHCFTMALPYRLFGKLPQAGGEKALVVKIGASRKSNAVWDSPSRICGCSLARMGTEQLDLTWPF